jgi:hypothetical protein
MGVGFKIGLGGDHTHPPLCPLSLVGFGGAFFALRKAHQQARRFDFRPSGVSQATPTGFNALATPRRLLPAV